MQARLTGNHVALGMAALLLSALALGAEVRCSEAGAQRTSLQSLQDQIDGLAARSDRQLALVDAEASQVGTVVSFALPQNGNPFPGGPSEASVLFDIPGTPLFVLGLEGGQLFGSARLRFAAVDCLGAPFVEGLGGPFAVVFQPAFSGGTTYVGDTSVPPSFFVGGSSRDASGFCEVDVGNGSAFVHPAIAAFVWDEDFVPPFEIVTLRDLAP